MCLITPSLAHDRQRLKRWSDDSQSRAGSHAAVLGKDYASFPPSNRNQQEYHDATPLRAEGGSLKGSREPVPRYTVGRATGKHWEKGIPCLLVQLALAAVERRMLY